jgi:SWIM/SEC-C metal-binding protein
MRERTEMAKLGTKRRPAIVHVETEARAGEILEICESHGWQVSVGIEPDKPEDITDIRTLMNRAGPLPGRTERVRPVSGNDYCPCGSGLKFKRCCMSKPSE